MPTKSKDWKFTIVNYDYLYFIENILHLLNCNAILLSWIDDKLL